MTRDIDVIGDAESVEALYELPLRETSLVVPCWMYATAREPSYFNSR